MCRIKKLAELCRNKTVYIQTHNFPDPDAISSAFGLQKLLHHYGITSKICYAGRIDNISTEKMLKLFQIEMHALDTLQEEILEADYIICVDSQKNNGNITDLTGQETAVIDHHPTFAKATYFYEDLRITGACASIIASYFAETNITPDCDTATALLYGIKMDTLQFSRGVTSLDISMFAFLQPLIDETKMKCVECNNMVLNDLRAYGAAIEHINVYDSVGFSCIPFSCPDALIATISNFILSLEEVQISIIFAFRADGIKFSVRSEIPDIHAGILIHQALKNIGSGGGHAGIAGGLIPEQNIGMLGNNPENRIIQLFLQELENITMAEER
jgi:nanoRNase/pAp phosphatase (c-di-AMP/oligoRNAs hydrolase)